MFLQHLLAPLNNYEEARNAGIEPSFSMPFSCVPGFLINLLGVIQRALLFCAPGARAREKGASFA
jgi:hypothetical protein